MTSRFDVGWLLIRVVFGLYFSLNHGMAKVFDPERMAGFQKTVGSIGFPAPEFFAWVGALTEFVGGLLIALGLFTRPAAALASFMMLVALYRTAGGGFPKMQLTVLFLTTWIATLFIGAGRFSVDRLLARRVPPKLARLLR